MRCSVACPLAGVVLLAACGNKNPAKVDALFIPAPCTTTAGSTVSVRKLAEPVGDAAMLVTAPADDGRLFVVEQRGQIRVYENEQLKPKPFLDISAASGGPVVAGGELGLLGLAFHPQYAQNGQFFVFYTTTVGGAPYADVLARYQVSNSDPNVAAPTGTIVLSIPDPFANHNGGMLEFGADGFLYIGTGDGGSAGDPQRNAQNPSALLGKILRIDVDHKASGKQYGTPSDNPFAGGGGAPEVFILGVRNPWRWSFDRATGDMWIGDVGQDVTEELDVVKAGEQRGANLGWSAFEGAACCMTQGDKCRQAGTQQACTTAGKMFGVDYRDHSTGWNAIIGGQVYRGSCYPDLVGWYFYTDNGHSGLSKARLKPDGTLEIVDLPGSFPRSPASIHADARGELFETDTGGNVYHIEAGP
ncbi:MAG TPA: PQQ-dependent sugar dehydrogenase [Kofleriaceae bacterium]|jgi:glucose/arabinose dehydrogenase